ncbi:MAG: hypothetical protein IIW54_16565, partial [Lachnospiraceae bacterium]|nr:hypothetical protein [Lachnospiraceae bacterium]
IARRMNAQIEGLKQANNNANDGLSVVNTADGAMSEMHSIRQRMNELSIQAANGTNADTDRKQIQMEIDQLVNEIDRIAKTTEFNAQNLLDGSFAYKAYTNNENIKVKACGDGVVNGNYMINSISYSYYSSKITTYDKDGNIEKVGDEESYKFDSEDSIRNSLVTTSSIAKNAKTKAVSYPDDLKGFPDGSNVSIDNSVITIKADNNFELKLDVNNRNLKNKVENQDNVVSTCTVPKYAVTDTYRNITIMDKDNNARYNISELSFYYENDNGIQDLKQSTSYSKYNSKTIYSGSEEEGLKNIGEDLKDFFEEKCPDCEVKVTSVSYNKDSNKLIINYDYNNTKSPSEKGTEKFEFSLDTETDPNATNKKLDDFLYQKSETVITQYTIGNVGNGNSKAAGNNGIMLDVTGAGAMRLQVGANEGQVIAIDIPNLDAESLGVAGLDITTEDKATAAIDRIGDAINQLSAVRAKIGAYANRIEHTITNLDTTEENMTASYSQIMDVDMAKEMTEYSTVQVLVQASTSVLAQANERPQQVLQLLQ